MAGSFWQNRPASPSLSLPDCFINPRGLLTLAEARVGRCGRACLLQAWAQILTPSAHSIGRCVSP